MPQQLEELQLQLPPTQPPLTQLVNNKPMLVALLHRARAVDVVCPVIQAKVAFPAKLVLPVNQENLELPADPVDHQLFATRRQFHHANNAHLVPLDNPDPMEIVETQEIRDKEADRVILEPQVTKDPLALLDHPEMAAKMETKESPEDLPQAPLTFPAKLVHQEITDPQVYPETTDQAAM